MTATPEAQTEEIGVVEAARRLPELRSQDTTVELELFGHVFEPGTRGYRTVVAFILAEVLVVALCVALAVTGRAPGS